MNSLKDKPLWTSAEMRHILGITRQTLHKWVSEGVIPSDAVIKVSGRNQYFIPEKVVNGLGGGMKIELGEDSNA